MRARVKPLAVCVLIVFLAAVNVFAADGPDLLVGRGDFEKPVPQEDAGKSPFQFWTSTVSKGKYSFSKVPGKTGKWALDIKSLPGGGIIQGKTAPSSQVGWRLAGFSRRLSSLRWGRAEVVSDSFKVWPEMREVVATFRANTEAFDGILKIEFFRDAWKGTRAAAFVPRGLKGWREYKLPLRYYSWAPESVTYHAAVVVCGKGRVLIDDLRLLPGKALHRFKRPVYVINVMFPAKDPDKPARKYPYMSSACSVLWGRRAVMDYHWDVTPGRVAKIDPACILLTPQGPSWKLYAEEDMKEAWRVIRESRVPVLGICGGHQFLGLAYGVQVDKISDAPTGLGDTSVSELRVLKSDPLFEGLPRRPNLRVEESHGWEVKFLHRDFELLATNPLGCWNQIMRHKTRFIYGIQSHPERGWNADYPEGQILWDNFFRIVDEIDTQRK